MELSLQCTSFPSQQLNELSNSHTRREPMRVHNDIGADSQLIVRQVFLRHNKANHSFLTMSTAEFVTHLWNTGLA